MLLTPRANFTRHADEETGYLISGGSVGQQSDRRGLAPQDEKKKDAVGSGTQQKENRPWGC